MVWYRACISCKPYSLACILGCCSFVSDGTPQLWWAGYENKLFPRAYPNYKIFTSRTMFIMCSPEVRCVGVNLCTIFLQPHHAQKDKPEIESLRMDVKRLLGWYDSLTPDDAESILCSESTLCACMGYENFWSSVIKVTRCSPKSLCLPP